MNNFYINKMRIILIILLIKFILCNFLAMFGSIKDEEKISMNDFYGAFEKGSVNRIRISDIIKQYNSASISEEIRTSNILTTKSKKDIKLPKPSKFADTLLLIFAELQVNKNKEIEDIIKFMEKARIPLTISDMYKFKDNGRKDSIDKKVKELLGLKDTDKIATNKGKTKLGVYSINKINNSYDILNKLGKFISELNVDSLSKVAKAHLLFMIYDDFLESVVEIEKSVNKFCLN